MAWRVALAAISALLAWPMQPVLAQGALQQFFSGGPPPPRLFGYQAPRPYRSPNAWPAPPGHSPLPSGDGWDSGPAAPVMTYRTLCVRLCDGFYFPISFATGGAGLSRDADACSASCGAEARLFYYPNAGGSIEAMVDLAGFGYAALPNAFKYRKTLVEGCQCRPQPWSETELQRHRGYAQRRPDTRPAERGGTERPSAQVRAVAPTSGRPPAWPYAAGGSQSPYLWPRER